MTAINNTPKGTRNKAGRKELLTLALAKKIILMIQQFPDANIEVNWDNVITQVERRFGHKFHRNVLSQKTWDGRKLIAEAVIDAKAIQRRMVKEVAPKYSKSPRSRLRLMITKLQAENIALREQLSLVRSQQYNEMFSLLDLRTPLNQVIACRDRC